MKPSSFFALTVSLALGSALVVPALGAVPQGAQASAPSATNAVIQWNNAALQGVRDSKLGPPMVARALAIVHTCIYDAWAAYDRKAVGTRLGGSLRRPRPERTAANKTEAISFAAYRALVDLLPGDQASRADASKFLFDDSDLSKVHWRQ